MKVGMTFVKVIKIDSCYVYTDETKCFCCIPHMRPLLPTVYLMFFI